MPIMKTTKGGKTGYKFGPHGTVYTGPGAKQKALRQARAMFAAGYRGKKK